MTSNREELETVLKMGKQILSARPELSNMNLDDVLNELDDGTPEMIHYRWGVTAWIVVNNIDNFEPKALVKYLSEIESGLPTYEYAGYLLLTEYRVNLEELLLCAERYGQFDKIILFVSANIIYETEMYEQNVVPILPMMENHINHRSYHIFLRNYAKHIEKLKGQQLVEYQMGALIGQAQYDLMYYLCAGWYENNATEAGGVIERLLIQESIWSKRAAVKYLDTSLYYDKSLFKKHLSKLEEMASCDGQIWLIIIPLFINYIVLDETSAGQDEGHTSARILGRLKQIPDGSLDEKYSFLESLRYQEKDIPPNLRSIGKEILAQSFHKEKRFLDILDDYLYIQLQERKWEKAIDLMQEIFIANQYSEDYGDFFGTLNLVRGEISSYSIEMTQQALKSMLYGNLNQLFFGLGLLMEFGSAYTFKEAVDSGLLPTFTDFQLIRLAKAILYFSVDTQQVCQIIFELLELSSSTSKQYVEFCLDEVFGNYPATMYETAQQYIASKRCGQADLSRKIIQEFEQQTEARKRCYEIKDLRLPREYNYVYRKARMEQNKGINKKAKKESFWGQLFSSRTLKYGVRNAHILIGRKREKIFQVSPYAHIQHEVEMPMLYVLDPVDFGLRQQAYLKEVKENAPNFKGLSTPTKREG